MVQVEAQTYSVNFNSSVIKYPILAQLKDTLQSHPFFNISSRYADADLGIRHNGKVTVSIFVYLGCLVLLRQWTLPSGVIELNFWRTACVSRSEEVLAKKDIMGDRNQCNGVMMYASVTKHYC